MEASMELAKQRKTNAIKWIYSFYSRKYTNNTRRTNRTSFFGSYSSFIGSPLSQGLYQFDLWGETPSFRWPWKNLMKIFIIRC